MVVPLWRVKLRDSNYFLRCSRMGTGFGCKLALVGKEIEARLYSCEGLLKEFKIYCIRRGKTIKIIHFMIISGDCRRDNSDAG